MRKIFFIVLLVFFICFVSSASYWVDDPVNCPATDSTNFEGQDCYPNNICGDSSGIAQCFATSTMSAPSVSTTSSTQYTSSFGGGYLVNCEATADALEPFCDNSGNFWCNRDSTCSNVNRLTNCSESSFANFSCSTCISGYTYCDGSYTDADGCEVDIDTTSFPGESNAVYNSTCGASCSGSYLDCNSDLGTGGDGCEILNGGACTLGSLSGTYSGCSGSSGNCVVTPSNFVTGNESAYSTNNSLLWGSQYGSGYLINMTNGTYTRFGVNNSGCIVFPDGTTQCTSISGSGGGNASWNESYADGLYAPNTSAGIQDLINGTNMLFGDVDFNSGWQSGGVSILGGNLFAQVGYFYNITSLNVNSLFMNGSFFPSFDDMFDIGNTSLRWQDLFLSGNIFSDGTGDNYFLGNVGIGTMAPTHRLHVNGSVNVTGDLFVNGINVTANLGGNASWNESYAGGLYANIQWDYNQTVAANKTIYETYNSVWSSGGNVSWNESYANGLYAPNTSAGIQDLINGTIINFATLGLGISSPLYTLHVIGDALFNLTSAQNFGIINNSGSNLFSVNGSNGFVGIGTSIPSHEFNVIGTGNFTGDLFVNGINVTANLGAPQNAIMAFNQADCPSGWILADGSLGTPDLRGIFIRGAGTNENVFPSNGADNYTATYGSYQNDSMQGHYHETTVKTSTGGTTRVAGGTSAGSAGTVPGNNGVMAADSDGTNGVPRTSYETAPASYALIYCMKIGQDSATSNSIWGTSGDWVFVQNASKNVGIGTTNVTQKLDVGGNVNVTGTLYINGGTDVSILTANVSFTSSGDNLVQSNTSKSVVLSNNLSVGDDVNIVGQLNVSGASRVRVTRPTAQTINSGAVQIVLYNSEEFDNLGEYNVVNCNFTAKQAGYYYISASISNTGDVRGEGDFITLFVYKNGVNAAVLFRHYLTDSVASALPVISGSTILYLSAGQYIDIRVQTSNTFSTNENGAYNFLVIHRLS